MPGAKGYSFSQEVPDSRPEAGWGPVIKKIIWCYMGRNRIVREGPEWVEAVGKAFPERGKARACGHQRMHSGDADG